MSRPRKPIEEKRSLQIVIKLTVDEYLELQELINYSEKNASEVIRQLVFKKRVLKPKVARIDVETYTQLRRIGNNLNQFVKALNQNHQVADSRTLLLEIRDLFRKICVEILNK